MKKKYPYTCPCCHADSELEISRWRSHSYKRDWECPHCGEHLGTKYSHPVLYYTCNIALSLGLLLTFILAADPKNRWFALAFIIVYFLAGFGLEALMWPPVVIRKPRTRDYTDKESGGKDV